MCYVRTWRPGGQAAEKKEGMEPDDLLCSRNARPPKALVGRAQWKINQPPSLKRERASSEVLLYLLAAALLGCHFEHPAGTLFCCAAGF